MTGDERAPMETKIVLEFKSLYDRTPTLALRMLWAACSAGVVRSDEFMTCLALVRVTAYNNGLDAGLRKLTDTSKVMQELLACAQVCTSRRVHSESVAAEMVI